MADCWNWSDTVGLVGFSRSQLAVLNFRFLLPQWLLLVAFININFYSVHNLLISTICFSGLPSLFNTVAAVATIADNATTPTTITITSTVTVTVTITTTCGSPHHLLHLQTEESYKLQKSFSNIFLITGILVSLRWHTCPKTFPRFAFNI